MNEGLRPKIVEKASLNAHLTPGVKPIMACLFSLEDSSDKFSSTERASIYERFNPELDDVENVIYDNENRYVISPVNEKRKFVGELNDCTSLIVTGIDKKTGNNVSFLTHMDPKKFLYEKRDAFLADLQQRLSEIKERCLPGTIDAVIVGGKYLPVVVNNKRIETKQNYLDSIKLVSDETQKVLTFKPPIINGPKMTDGSDNICFDTTNRQLYFMRPKVNRGIRSFTSF